LGLHLLDVYHAVVLSPLDCNLDVVLRDGNLTCSKLTNDGFGYMAAGCRANVGLIEGKAYFKVKSCLV
jgi:hypothetical protein